MYEYQKIKLSSKLTFISTHAMLLTVNVRFMDISSKGKI